MKCAWCLPLPSQAHSYTCMFLPCDVIYYVEMHGEALTGSSQCLLQLPDNEINKYVSLLYKFLGYLL